MLKKVQCAFTYLSTGGIQRSMCIGRYELTRQMLFGETGEERARHFISMPVDGGLQVILQDDRPCDFWLP